MVDMKNVTSLGRLRRDDIAFDLIFVVGFVLLLAVALLAQLLTLKWRLWLPGAEGDSSLIQGVRQAVSTFMSYLN